MPAPVRDFHILGSQRPRPSASAVIYCDGDIDDQFRDGVMHLQLHTFLTDPITPNPEALARFAHVIELAEDRELYVLVTGLNLFYPGENPPWVGQQTDEATHWATQAAWWTAMANALHDSPGVFGYDLMNEPFVTGNLVHDDGVWWTNVAPSGYCSYGEDQAHGLHGTCFGQSITPDRGTRSAAEVAGAWTRQMVHAIRFAGVSQRPGSPRHGWCGRCLRARERVQQRARGPRAARLPRGAPLPR